MSFLNPTPVPVTLYSSADTDAPQLATNNWTGAIKTILKACLVTGYGSKPAAGWEIDEEDANKATFTPTDAAANYLGIYVDSSLSTHTLIDFIHNGVRQNITRFNRIDRNTRVHEMSWDLIATERGFAFIPGYKYGDVITQMLLYFGTMCHNLTNPTNRDFIYLNTSNNSGSSFAQQLVNPNMFWSVDVVTNTSASLASSALTWRASNGNKFASAGDTTSKLYAPIYIIKDDMPVGVIPGLLLQSHRYESDLAEKTIKIEGSTHDYLLTQQNSTITFSVATATGAALAINQQEWVY